MSVSVLTRVAESRWQSTPARRDVEGRTGTCQNMLQYGFLPTKFTVAGAPTRFVRRATGGDYAIARTKTKEWRVSKISAVAMRGRYGGQYYPEAKYSEALFPGPVAAAVWLTVELSHKS